MADGNNDSRGGGGDGIGPDLTPRKLSKVEFGQRLRKAIAEKGWSQSDAARASGLGRDAISTYIKGRSFPSDESATKLARGLGIPLNQLLPNTQLKHMERETAPALEIKQSAASPGKMWVQVNQLVDPDQAFEIMQILQRKQKDDDSD